MGSILSSWWRMDRATAVAGAITSVAGVGSGDAAAQASGTKQPTLVAGVGTARQAARFDGSNDTLEAVLPATFGTRAYCWAVSRAHTLPGAGVAYAGIAYGGAVGHLAPIRMTTTRFTCVIGSGDGTDIINGPLRDSNVHLFEASFETSGTARYVVDGVAFNGSFSGPPFGSNIGNFCFGAFQPPESSNGPFDHFEVGLTTSLPTAAQRQQLRDYVKRRYRI